MKALGSEARSGHIRRGSLGRWVVLGLAGCSGVHAMKTTAPKREGTAPAVADAVAPWDGSVARVLAATVQVSRSTNSPAIEVTVYRDGSAERTLGALGQRNFRNVMPKVYPPRSPDVVAFLADLDAVGDVSALPIAAYCPKSASFGTTTTVSARGHSSGDLQCLEAPSAIAKALANDCSSLAWKP